LPSLVFRTPFDVDPVEQEPAGKGESAPVAATETRPEPHIAERWPVAARGLRPSAMAVRVGA